jgi:DNA-binding NarL/FixJ family response regulator
MIRVAIFATNTMLQAGLQALLDGYAELELVVVEDPMDCDVLLLCGASTWRDSNLIETPLLEPHPALLIIADDIEPYRALLESAGGGIGILPEDASKQEITAAIHALSVGLVSGSAALLRRLFDYDNLVHTDAPMLAQDLTSREGEVLELLFLGLLNKEIADRLEISEHTVKYHISSIFTKLRVSNRVEAIRAGIQLGLLNL